ncbi:MAG TPA: hypothetical protein VK607_13145, partial [Kofleriaceae bacterium]|nr:hypothetical protein [Kofleriaceae bacterium]
MDIASYPIGILIGLFPVLVDLGPTGKPAELLLDGKPACEITARAPGCTIDLGAAPRIHRLDLVRRDPSGQVVEKVSRWVSRPGLQAEVDASGDCEDRSRTCTFHVGWGHPAKQDPKTLLLSLDGVIVHTGVSQAIRIRFPGKGWPPQVVSVDAVFPDGRRANSTHLLRGSYPEETEASLQAVPLQSEAGPLPPDLAAELTAAGWNLKALEEGEDEIVFVVEPGALTASSRMDEGAPRLLVGMLRSGVLGRTGVDGVRATHVVVGNEDLAASEVRPASPSRVRRSVWLDRLLNAATTRFSWARTADAVAAAGYSVAGSPRRRLLVLVLGSDTRDESVMSSHAVLDYLEQALVPIVVWRMGATAGAGWPEGPRILNLADFRREAEVLRFTLDHQRVAWIDGRIDLRDFRPSLPAGVRL